MKLQWAVLISEPDSDKRRRNGPSWEKRLWVYVHAVKTWCKPLNVRQVQCKPVQKETTISSAFLCLCSIFEKNLLKSVHCDRQREADLRGRGGAEEGCVHVSLGKTSVIERWGICSGVLMVSLSPQRLAQMSGQLWGDLHPVFCLYLLIVCGCVSECVQHRSFIVSTPKFIWNVRIP